LESKLNNNILKNFKNDLPAGIVVFFVALPLCLGIALASGAPLFSGIIAGIIGGIVVGALSGSALGISGPAAGLAVIVLTSIESLGSWQTFLLSVVLAGFMQVIMGFGKAGVIAYFFPSSVIKGMLTGIGLLIIVKQIPYALGYNNNLTGDSSITPGAVLIGLLSLAILFLWDKVLIKKHKIFQLIQGPIVVIAIGIGLNYLYQIGFIGLSLSSDQIVSMPVPDNLSSFLAQFTTPDFSSITNIEVWKVAFIIAIVASLETLLSAEATDKLDPNNNVTPTNRELKAQGIGNIISGLIGGLPITQVIVRSSANISFGGKTKMSGILHGFFLLISVVSIANILNMIPLSSLAAILLIVGFKLAKPKLFREMYALGWDQFIPFTATVAGILFTDLLTGLIIGMSLGIFYTLRENYRNSHQIEDVVSMKNGNYVHHITLAEDVSFLNKVSIMKTLRDIPENSKVIIDYSKSKSLAYDVVEVLAQYEENAKLRNTTLEKINFNELH